MSLPRQVEQAEEVLDRRRLGTRVASPEGVSRRLPESDPVSPARPAVTSAHAPGLAPYTNLVIAAGALVLAFDASQLSTVDPAQFAALVAVAVVASFFKIDLRLSSGSATMTLGYAVGFVGLLTLGSHATGLAVAASIWTQCTYGSGFSAAMDLRRRLFSVACGAITVEAAGGAFDAVAAQSGVLAAAPLAAPLAAAAIAYFFVNTALIAGAIALSTGQHVVEVWQKNFLLSWPSYFMSALVVGLGTVLVERSGYLAGLLVLLPLLLTFFAYRAYLGRIADEQAQLKIAKNTSVIDVLTGLPNRLFLIDRIDRLLIQHRAHPGSQFALLFVDLDGFKQINDTLGHHVGDQLLQAFSRRLEDSLRAVDSVIRGGSGGKHIESTVARLGGDEFVVLIDHVTAARDAQRVADRLQAVTQQPFDLAGRQLYITASVGISLGSSASSTAEDVLRDADSAMYRAKTLGKARSELFDASVNGHVQGRARRESELKQAVERHEFIPYFQPIVNLRDGQLAGFEALLRWQHPDRGVVEPADFITMMEENGLVSAVGRRFFSDVCRQLADWEADGLDTKNIAIHVNFSGQQFLDPRLVDDLLAMTEFAGVSPKQFVIEVTETSAIRQFDRAIEVLERARAAGLRIALDDFGTGYSSLSCLHELPISAIKLDRSFLARERRHPAILQAIVTLAAQLNLSITAEGVETIEQCQSLRDIGCDFAQGFLFSRPVPASQAEACLRRSRPWFSNTESGRVGTVVDFSREMSLVAGRVSGRRSARNSA